jgi:hypothetical protein
MMLFLMLRSSRRQSVISCQLSVVSCQLSVVSCQLSVPLPRRRLTEHVLWGACCVGAGCLCVSVAASILSGRSPRWPPARACLELGTDFFWGGRSCNSAPFFKNTVFQFWYESITGAKTFYPCRLADSESLRTPVFLAPVLVCLMLTSVAGVV